MLLPRKEGTMQGTRCVKGLGAARQEKQRRRTAVQVALNRAFQAGKILPGRKCEICGADGDSDRRVICLVKDGKHFRYLVAHHDDYNKPLDIRWLCIPCHRKLHITLARAQKEAENAK
jgi:hypothetical protein